MLRKKQQKKKKKSTKSTLNGASSTSFIDERFIGPFITVSHRVFAIFTLQFLLLHQVTPAKLCWCFNYHYRQWKISRLAAPNNLGFRKMRYYDATRHLLWTFLFGTSRRGGWRAQRLWIDLTNWSRRSLMKGKRGDDYIRAAIDCGWVITFKWFSS